MVCEIFKFSPCVNKYIVPYSFYDNPTNSGAPEDWIPLEENGAGNHFYYMYVPYSSRDLYNNSGWTKYYTIHYNY